MWRESARGAEDRSAQRGSQGSQCRRQKPLDGRFLEQAEPAALAADRSMSRTHRIRPALAGTVGERIAEMAGRQGSPDTGKLSARPAGRPGDYLLVKGEFATIPST